MTKYCSKCGGSGKLDRGNGSTKPCGECIDGLIEASARTYSTKEVARICHLTLRKIQWWNEHGLIHPRIRGHNRQFTDADLTRIRLIRDLRAKGVSIQQVGKMPLRKFRSE